MRARQPDSTGRIDCDGVEIYYELHGDEGPTILLLPTWMIIHSRFWKLQVPYLARHFRVITYDSPGNGKSDRPLDPKAHGVYAHLRYTEAVLDEVGVDRAVLVGLSAGGSFGLSFAAEHPDRVLGLALIGPATPVLKSGPSERRRFINAHFDLPYPQMAPSRVSIGVRDDPGDWNKYNRQYWIDELEDFGWFFFGHCFPEPHSTKQIEDCAGWTMETTGELLGAEADAPDGDVDTYRDWASLVGCPALLIHGSDDYIVPISVSEELARLTGGDLVRLQGSGHIPNAREPVKVNFLLKDFVDRAAAPMVGSS
ncbi:MAG: alpha/beta fold hydrolase [Acidimicrobiia bacterium]